MILPQIKGDVVVLQRLENCPFNALPETACRLITLSTLSLRGGEILKIVFDILQETLCVPGGRRHEQKEAVSCLPQRHMTMSHVLSAA